MKNRAPVLRTGIFGMFAIFLLTMGLGLGAVPQICLAEALTAEGTVQKVSMKARTIQFQTEGGVRIVHFGDGTKLTNLDNPKQIKEGAEMTLIYEERGGGLHAVEIRARPLVELEPGMEIRAGELRKMLLGDDKSRVTVVDARPSGRYAEAHLPGAINVFAKTFAEQKDRLPEDKDRLLVFYCGGPRCGLSPKAAGLAREMGYTRIRVYKMGEPDWRKRKLPLYSSAGYVDETIKADTGIVVVDGRPGADVAAGHIPGAVAIPFAAINDAEDDFPSYRKAPIVVYGGGPDVDEADDAALAIRRWGYQNVTVLEGGYAAWQRAGFAVDRGPAAAEIEYVRRLGPGEISADEFETIATTRPAGTILVDCRDPEEFEEGHIPGALNIPADDVTARLAELPRETRIITYCNTGVRAEMAYHLLKESGYRTAFLNRELTLEEDGTFEVEE